MEINVIISDGAQTQTWHINPTQCDFMISPDGSLTIKPADSAWVQVLRGVEVVNTHEQIDPTTDPWPRILQRYAEIAAACEEARAKAAEANAQ